MDIYENTAVFVNHQSLEWAKRHYAKYPMDNLVDAIADACGGHRLRRAAEVDQAVLVKVKQILVISFLL